jgi:hypothetical protein
MSAATFRDAIAIDKSGIPGWKPCIWEAIGEGTRDSLISGGVPRLLTRGPNKGHPRWEGKLTRVVVSGVEVEAAMAKYEGETGHCAECEGSCKTVAGWSAAEGTRYRPCAKCDSTGKAKIMEAA